MQMCDLHFSGQELLQSVSGTAGTWEGGNKCKYLKVVRLIWRTSCFQHSLPTSTTALPSTQLIHDGLPQGFSFRETPAINLSSAFLMDVSPHNQSGDRPLTDRKQIVNLYEMSWLVGTRRETRRGLLRGETRSWQENIWRPYCVWSVSLVSEGYSLPAIFYLSCNYFEASCCIGDKAGEWWQPTPVCFCQMKHWSKNCKIKQWHLDHTHTNK